ncbi:hypothetical protein [Pseudocolwellia sp. HL-MZ7]|uniref:hypothetical protein n=1 Tax=Pseudocolwellia sp. HL-MZ7 TaxID=3400627 RepID=UPI003CE8C8ED
MKRNKNISPILKRIVKHSYLLLLLTSSIPINAEERPGLLLNGSISAEHSDNVLNNATQTSDTAIVVTPNVKYLGLIGKHSVLFSYDGKFSTYKKE